MDRALLLQFIFSGLTMGAIYALVGLGFAITYSTTGIVNFAQGQFVMLGGILAASLHEVFGWPTTAAIICALILTSAAGLGVGDLLIRYMEKAKEFRLVLATLGMGIVIETLALLIWGTNPWSLPSLVGDGVLRMGRATLTVHSLLVIIITLVTMGTVILFFRRSRWGRAMVATSLNQTAAASLGIDVRFVIKLAFALSGFVGSLAGVIITPITATSYHVGFEMTIKGFAAAVLGGMGNPAGAVAGGFLFGLVEAMGTGYVSSGYKNAFAMAVFIVILLTRPQGLFGVKVRST